MPNNWKTYKVGELLKIKHGYAFKGEYFSDEVNENVLLTPGNFNADGGIKFNWDKQKFYKGTFSDEYILNKGDLIIALTDLTQSCSILGSTAIIKDNKYNYLHNQRLGLVKDINDLVHSSFLYYVFNNSRFRNHVIATKTGSTVSHTAPERIYNFEIKLPNLQEQQVIASILSAIDEKIENNLVINKTLEEMAMTLYKHWFLDFGPFQDGEFEESELGMIPKGWEVKKLGDFIKHKKGFAFKSNWYQQTGEIIVRVSDTTHNSIDIKSCERISSELASNYQNYSLSTNDVVIATVGSWPPNYSSVVGKVVRVPITANGALLNQNAVILNMSIDDVLQQGLLYCTLKNERFLKYIVNSAQGSASQASIKLTDIFNYLIPIGKKIKIEEFTLQIESYISQQNSLIEENQTLTQLRDTLLPKLISGEVRLKEFQEQLATIL